jgi:hypothetical protein
MTKVFYKMNDLLRLHRLEKLLREDGQTPHRFLIDRYGERCPMCLKRFKEKNNWVQNIGSVKGYSTEEEPHKTYVFFTCLGCETLYKKLDDYSQSAMFGNVSDMLCEIKETSY